MNENTDFKNSQKTTNGAKRWFSQLYRTRVKVQKDAVPVMNVSAGFTALGILCAPWLAVGGAAIALAMGYRFSVERNAQGFSSDFEDVVQEAASNVRSAVDSLTRNAARDEVNAEQPAASHKAQAPQNPFDSFNAQEPQHPFTSHMAEERPVAHDDTPSAPNTPMQDPD